MRTALASLILVAGLAGAAHAQDAAAPSTAAAPTAPAPAAPAPVLPTSGDGAQVIQAIEKVCVPAARGQGVEAAAKAAGLKRNRREGVWTMPLASGRDFAIIFQPLISQPKVCQAEVRFAVGQDMPIVEAIDAWASLQEPSLTLSANYVNVDADGVKRVRRSWEHFAADGAGRAVNFSVQRNPDDTPLNPRFDTAMLFYQERAAQ